MAKSKNLPCPVRSISLPSRLNPNGLKIEAELDKLKNLETSSHSAETIQAGVLGLVQLYNCVQELIQCSNTQKALAQHQNGAIVEEALEGSLELLESCDTIRNLFCMIKEQMQHLQSALRRKGADSSIEKDISNYLNFRKNMKKEIVKNLRRLKQMENRVGSSVFWDIEQHLSMVIRVLREVTVVTTSVFKALLVFLSYQDTKIKPRGWLMISKLMITKSSASSQGGQIFSDMGSVDIALDSLRQHIKNNETKVDGNVARRRLQTLDMSIEGFEAGLQSLYKKLIQSRVSFLNVLAL
ncbi:uncharacterized protein LOC107760968 [Nicotiana tabacum]|uniref:Uncharacterized protein LOC107760968 n=2 Tax=Nicotiana TaxID=4085 RepID=A0A1S3X458_TOBAC|nr:PREDICTED: uncharacterized protein LOC104233624 [Nicotiana sylvestris]XP_016434606.1 PREDICTED: uncharacterized protein LOC107760968 [Nicotiana tabacum]